MARDPGVPAVRVAYISLLKWSFSKENEAVKIGSTYHR